MQLCLTIDWLQRDTDVPRSERRLTMRFAPPRASGALRGTRRLWRVGTWASVRMSSGAWLKSVRAWRRVANL